RERRLPGTVELNLFRIVQEALSNCARHSGAARTCVELDFGRDQVVVRISDDGRGCAALDPTTLPALGHYGLASMRERAHHLGGTLTVRSAPAMGTVIVAQIPVESREE